MICDDVRALRARACYRTHEMAAASVTEKVSNAGTRDIGSTRYKGGSM